MSIVRKNISRRNSGRKLPPAKTFCEFFADIGLVRAGLEETGWKCIYANDIDPKKEEQYAERFKDDAHFHLGDVRDTDSIVARIHETPFLATASFPCVDLSLAGHWRGLDGEHSSTFYGFSSALEALGPRTPKLILVENVTGLITSGNGKDFASIAQTLARLGYWLDSFVIDARYFVPQSRPRIFVVGVHESLSTPDFHKSSANFSLGDPWQRTLSLQRQIRPDRLIQLMKAIDLATGWIATPIALPPTCQIRLDDLIDLGAEEAWWVQPEVEKHYQMMSDMHKDLVDNLRTKPGTHVGTIYRRKRHGSMRAEVRFDGIAGCLRTPKGGSARQIVVVVKNGELKIRWMSPREYARLQGADDYPLVGKVNQQLFGFGDAVCVPVISWIDRHVLTPLYELAARN